MCRNVRSIEWHQKTYHEISWDYPFKQIIFQAAICNELLVSQDLSQYELKSSRQHASMYIFKKKIPQ
jgi:hypothetical protein